MQKLKLQDCDHRLRIVFHQRGALMSLPASSSPISNSDTSLTAAANMLAGRVRRELANRAPYFEQALYQASALEEKPPGLQVRELYNWFFYQKFQRGFNFRLLPCQPMTLKALLSLIRWRLCWTRGRRVSFLSTPALGQWPPRLSWIGKMWMSITLELPPLTTLFHQEQELLLCR